MTNSPRLVRGLGLAVLAAMALWAAAVRPAAAQDQDPAPAKYRGAVQLQNDDLFDTAIDAWKKFLTDHPDHRLTPYARFNLGVCYLRTKKHAEAVEAFPPAIAGFEAYLKANPAPKDKETRDAVERAQGHLERAHLYLGAEQLELGRQTKKNEHIEKAVATFDALLKGWPKGKGTQADLGYYYRAEANYALGKKDLAVADYAALAKDFPDSAKLGDALYSVGFTRQEQQKWEAAAEAYSTFLNHEKLKQHPLLNEVRMRYGEALLEQGQFSEAEKWLQSAAATKDFPLADYATSRLADSYAQRKKYAEAADLYLSIPDKFPKLKNVDHGLALLLGGRNAYEARQYAKARTALGKVITAGGERSAEAAHWTARCFLAEQKPSEALKVADAALPAAKGTALETTLMLDRGDALYEIPDQRKASVAAYYEVAGKAADAGVAQQALYYAADAAMKSDDFTTALKYCDEFLVKHKESRLVNDLRSVQAESLLKSQQYDKAETVYQQLIDAAPQHRDQDLWRLQLGRCSYVQRKYEAAAAALKANLASIKRPELRAEANYLLGSSQVEIGQHAEAAKSLEASLDGVPTDWPLADDARVGLARALRRLRQPQKAVEQLRKVVAQKDSNVLINAHYELAECSYELEDYKTAAQECQWVIDQKETLFAPFALSRLGLTHVAQGKADEAVAAFTKVIDQFPQHAQAKLAYLDRGAALQKTKQFDKAEADLAKYLLLEPSTAQKSAIRFEIGKCQAAQKRHAEAEKTFTAILTEDAGYARTADVLFELGWALADQGKSAEAVKRFDELATKHPDNPLALEALLQVGEIRFQESPGKKPDYPGASKAYYDVADKAEKLAAAGKIAADRAASLRERAMHKYGWCHYHQGDYENAHKTFEYQLDQWGKGEFAADAQFMMGECLRQLSKFSAARAAFQAYLKDHAEGRFAPTAMWRAAESFNKVGVEDYAKADGPAQRKQALANHQQALDLVKDFATKYPRFESLLEVSYEEAQAQHYLGDKDKALALYETIATKTNREVAAKARFMVGEIHFEKAVDPGASAEQKQKSLQEAIKHFYTVWQGFGYETWQANGLYEAARCLEQLGNVAKAKERYQELIDKFPKSDKLPLAKKRLEKLAE
jgi:TolA-binding protein